MAAHNVRWGRQQSTCGVRQCVSPSVRAEALGAQAARAAARCACPPTKEAVHTCGAQPLWHRSSGCAARPCRGFDARRPMCSGPGFELEEHGGHSKKESPAGSHCWQGPRLRPAGGDRRGSRTRELLRRPATTAAGGRHPESPLEAATEHARLTAMHQPAHANGGIGGPGCTRLGAVRPTRSKKSTGPEKHGNSGTGPADLPRTGAGVLAHSLATAARATSSRSTAAMARRRAQSARAADRALRVSRRAVATAARWQVGSVGGLRLRPPDLSGAAVQESPLEAATEHARRTAMHQPAHADSGVGGPGCTRLGAVRPTRSEESAGPEKHSNCWHRSGGSAAHRCRGSHSRPCVQRPAATSSMSTAATVKEEGPVSSRR